jgi:hypothetical protein
VLNSGAAATLTVAPQQGVTSLFNGLVSFGAGSSRNQGSKEYHICGFKVFTCNHIKPLTMFLNSLLIIIL